MAEREITRDEAEAARLRALVAEMTSRCRIARDDIVKQIAKGGNRYDEVAAWRTANLLQGIIAKAEAEARS
jgi:hypothetical protein